MPEFQQITEDKVSRKTLIIRYECKLCETTPFDNEKSLINHFEKEHTQEYKVKQ